MKEILRIKYEDSSIWFKHPEKIKAVLQSQLEAFIEYSENGRIDGELASYLHGEKFLINGEVYEYM